MPIREMMGASSIDDDFWENGFNLSTGSAPTIAHRKDDPVRPFISSAAAWNNYSDDVVYEVDKACRDWIETMAQNHQWACSWRMRRYDYSMLWWCIFGTEAKEDPISKSNQMKICRIFAYYSSTIKRGYVNASWSKTKKPSRMYIISPKRVKLAPYSLRLRIEWLTERGYDLTFNNMKVPEDDLHTGQSRSPRTQKGIQRRHEIGLKNYQKRWGEYQHAYQEEYRRRKKEERTEGRSDS